MGLVFRAGEEKADTVLVAEEDTEAQGAGDSVAAPEENGAVHVAEEKEEAETG